MPAYSLLRNNLQDLPLENKLTLSVLVNMYHKYTEHIRKIQLRHLFFGTVAPRSYNKRFDFDDNRPEKCCTGTANGSRATQSGAPRSGIPGENRNRPAAAFDKARLADRNDLRTETTCGPLISPRRASDRTAPRRPTRAGSGWFQASRPSGLRNAPGSAGRGTTARTTRRAR